MPRLITGLDAAPDRAPTSSGCARRSPTPGATRPRVDILAAVKYVPLDEIGTLHEAGLTLLGENRAQELEDKATLHPDFRWHFIGQLQSRKVKQILPYVELIHSVASESALRQLEQHGDAGDRDPARGQRRRRGGQGGYRPGRAAALSRALARQGRGADDDAAVRGGSGGQPAAFRPPGASSPAEHGLPQLSMGTSQDYAVAAAEGATIVRIGTTLYT